jgi:predicted nucleic acid-binding protein
VRVLLQSGDAACRPVVRLELWNGARGGHEKQVLLELERELAKLEISADVWDLACGLARKARQHGKTVSASDLLIAACARHHAVEIEHADSHFDVIATL